MNILPGNRDLERKGGGSGAGYRTCTDRDGNGERGMDGAGEESLAGNIVAAAIAITYFE